MNKPKENDIVVLANPLESIGDPDTTEGLVVAVFDSLDVPWDPFGESAWAQHDHNESCGKKADDAEWYVIIEPIQRNGEIHAGETLSLASWEVSEVRTKA